MAHYGVRRIARLGMGKPSAVNWAERGVSCAPKERGGKEHFVGNAYYDCFTPLQVRTMDGSIGQVLLDVDEEAHSSTCTAV